MIDESLKFLKNSLNNYLSLDTTNAQEEIVVFLDGQNIDPLVFKLGTISVLLINIEEENTLRRPDQYTRIAPNGDQQKVYPDIRLNLYVLFVAHFKEYEDSLRYLSQTIRYFQSYRVLDQHNAPELSDNIEKLIVELITLPFSEQNEVWNALRVTYHPSVLYKVKMLVFKNEEIRQVPEITEKDTNIRSTS